MIVVRPFIVCYIFRPGHNSVSPDNSMSPGSSVSHRKEPKRSPSLEDDVDEVSDRTSVYATGHEVAYEGDLRRRGGAPSMRPGSTIRELAPTPLWKLPISHLPLLDGKDMRELQKQGDSLSISCTIISQKARLPKNRHMQIELTTEVYSTRRESVFASLPADVLAGTLKDFVVRNDSFVPVEICSQLEQSFQNALIETEPSDYSDRRIEKANSVGCIIVLPPATESSKLTILFRPPLRQDESRRLSILCATETADRDSNAEQGWRRDWLPRT